MAKNIRSEYVKNLIAEKDNLNAMLCESTSEAIKSYLGESVNKGIRNILSEAEDSFTEEEVEDTKPKLKNSKKDAKKDSKKDEDSKKESKKKNSYPKDDEFDDFSEDDEFNEEDDINGNEDDEDDFDIEDGGDFESDDDTKDGDDFDSDNGIEDDEFETDDDDDFSVEKEGGEEDPDEEVWSSVEQFIGEDGEYDLTEQDKDTVMKVLKVMKPEDGVRIVQKDNGMYELNDENNDVEYIIDLNGNEDMNKFEMNESQEFDDLDNERSNDEFGDEFDDNFESDEFEDSDEKMSDESTDEEIDTDLDDKSDDDDVFDNDSDDDFVDDSVEYEFEVELDSDEGNDDLDPMDDECNMYESLGYDPHYGQDKTAMTMPYDDDDDNGSQIKMNAGLPKGSKNNGQRWVGNTSGKIAPYTTNKSETIYEVELDGDVYSSDDTFNTSEMNDNSQPATSEDMGGARVNRTRAHNSNEAGKPRFERNHVGRANESFNRKVKAIMAENKELKKIAKEIEKRLQENVVVNASLGKMIKLMVENTTSRDEKISILNRFNKVKSVKEGKALYESISSELKRSHKINESSQLFGQPLTEAKKTKQQIVENRLTESPDVTGMQDMINRLENLNKKR